jgi:hypothetical protein
MPTPVKNVVIAGVSSLHFSFVSSIGLQALINLSRPAAILVAQF